MRKALIILTSVLIAGVSQPLRAQEINWLSFNQLDSALAAESKPVFLDFYTEWCTYCRKMDKQVFVKPAVVETMNRDYYAVKMDAETREVIRFDGRTWENKQATNKRDGFHQLALLLGAKNGEFAPPAMLFFNNDFEVEARFFEYLNSKRLLKFLRSYNR